VAATPQAAAAGLQPFNSAGGASLPTGGSAALAPPAEELYDNLESLLEKNCSSHRFSRMLLEGEEQEEGKDMEEEPRQTGHGGAHEHHERQAGASATMIAAEDIYGAVVSQHRRSR